MKRSHLLCCGACMALLLAAPLWAAEADWEAALRRKLEKEIKVDFANKPVAHALQHLANETGCRIALDTSVRAGSTVTFTTQGMPAGSALGWVCFLTDSRWVLDDEMLLVCSPEKAASLVEKQRRTYDLSKVAPKAPDAKAVKEVAELLLSCVGAGSVELEAGPRLAVRASEAGLASVGKLLDSLSRVPRNGKLAWEVPKPDSPPPIEIVTRTENWPATIKKAMDKKVTFDFVETPLQDVTNFLSSLADVPVILDAAAVRDGPNVTLRVNDMRLESALGWVVKLVGAGSAVTQHAVLVSTRERIVQVKDHSAPLAAAVHDVSDILAEGWELSEVVESLGELSDHPRAFMLGVGTRALAVVRAEREAEVAERLKAMRGPKLTPARPDRAKPPADQPDWVTRILDVLNKKVTFDFVETPIQDVVNFLSALVDVTIVLDTAAVRDAQTVTLRVNEMRLGPALRWVLRLVGLGYTLKDEAILITKREAIVEHVVARTLPAWGAVAKPEEARALAAFLDGLLKALPAASPRTSCKVRSGYLLHLVAREDHANVAEGVVGWLAHSKPGECHDLTETPGAVPPQKWEAKLRESLKKRVTFDFAETPVKEVLDFLRSQSDLTIVSDIQPAADQRLNVTQQGKEMPVGTALDSILKPLGLTQVMVDEAVLITTPKRAVEHRPAEWRLYDIRHVAREGLAATDPAQAIRKACQKHPQWAESHQIAEFQNRLVVCTTPAVHAVVEKMVEESLRSAPRP